MKHIIAFTFISCLWAGSLDATRKAQPSAPKPQPAAQPAAREGIRTERQLLDLIARDYQPAMWTQTRAEALTF